MMKREAAERFEAEAEARGEARILRETWPIIKPHCGTLATYERIGRMLVSIIVKRCAICGWISNDLLLLHPDNGCLWVRAQRAAAEAKEAQ